MAKTDNRYIQFYTPGSAACKVELRQEQDWAPLPEMRLRPRTLIHVDPVALVGIVVAVCMLVLMAVGIRQLNDSRREVAALEHYVAQLKTEKVALEESYVSGFDPDVIRRQAMDLGMVPMEEVPQTPIQIVIPPQPQEEIPLFERMTTALTNLFA